MPGDDAAARAAAIVADGIEAWASLARRWYDRARTGEGWTADDLRDDVTSFVDAARQPAEAAAGLAADLLRPWAEAFQSRRGGTPP